MAVCSHCGKHVSDEAIYCIWCGVRLESGSVQKEGLIDHVRALLRGDLAEYKAKV